MIDWLFTNALAALALAAIAGALIWTFRPSPTVRHALWLVVVLKLVSPTGLVVSVPLPVEPPIPIERDLVASHMAGDESAVVEEEVFTVMVNPQPGETAEEAAVAAMKSADEPAVRTDTRPGPAMQTAAPPAAAPPGEPFDYRPYLLGVWAAGAVVVGWRQGRDTVRFARFTARALPAGNALVAEVAVVANRLGVRVPAVRVLAGLASPVLWCLGRPVLLWPAGLECRVKGDGRRAVIAHELAHLRRRDHWVRRLEMAAAVLHWWNPLFWLVRRNLRADAELACDAWATGQADRRAYAEALLEVCSFNPRRRPAPAVGVIGEGRRAMQERLTMIMRDRIPCRLAFGAKLVVALMAMAAVPAWTLGQGDELAQADPAAEKQLEELQAQLKALAAKLEAIKAHKLAEGEKLKARLAAQESAEKLKEAAGGRAEAIRALVEKQAAGGKAHAAPGKVIAAGEGGYRVIGPDGKEVKDAKVIIVDPKAAGGGANWAPKMIEFHGGEGVKLWHSEVKPGTANYSFTPGQNVRWHVETRVADGQSVTLSRATYKLNKDQAAALGTLLGSVKASVMETKVDGESITVTTTPEVQAAIGQIVRLVQGQSGAATYQFRFNTTPDLPGTPGQPAKPAKPGQPEQPAKPEKPAAPSALVPGTSEVDKDAIKQRIEVELKQLDKLKDLENLKNLNIDVKGLEELKNLKIDLAKVKDLEKRRELDKAEALKSVEKRRVETNKARGDAEREREQLEKRQQELEKAIKALIGDGTKKPGSEKKPEGPAK